MPMPGVNQLRSAEDSRSSKGRGQAPRHRPSRKGKTPEELQDPERAPIRTPTPS